MQADSMSRFFAMTITDNGAPWTAPDGAVWTVRFGAPGMPAGWYDTITDTGGGTHPAVVVDENTVTVEIAEQAVSTPGQNILCALVTDAQGYQIASWPFVLSVQAVPGLEAPEATVYYNALTAQVAQTLANAQAAAASATQSAESATLSESWAVGGTGTREGEDTNNAEYWAGQAEEAAGSAVASFNSRTGAVMPQSGDYTAAMVGAATPQQIPNANELDNSGFLSGQRINQREVSGTISSAGYFIDRWKLVSGTVQLTDAGLVLNGTIAQILETSIGESFTASASAGSASYDDPSKTFTLVGTGETIAWAKLERGSVATPWQPKGYAEEYAACLRYFERIVGGTFGTLDRYDNANAIGLFAFSLPYAKKRTSSPTVTFLSKESYNIARFNGSGDYIGDAAITNPIQTVYADQTCLKAIMFSESLNSNCVFLMLQNQAPNPRAWIDISADL